MPDEDVTRSGVRFAMGLELFALVPVGFEVHCSSSRWFWFSSYFGLLSYFEISFCFGVSSYFGLSSGFVNFDMALFFHLGLSFCFVLSSCFEVSFNFGVSFGFGVSSCSGLSSYFDGHSKKWDEWIGAEAVEDRIAESAPDASGWRQMYCLYRRLAKLEQKPMSPA